MHANDDKRRLREQKKALKRSGNKHRRYAFKRQLEQNPTEAHIAQEDLGGRDSQGMNGMDRAVDGSD